MVRVTEWKISAFNILDYIFIHDLASMSTFSDLKNEFYGYVTDEIDTGCHERSSPSPSSRSYLMVRPAS